MQFLYGLQIAWEMKLKIQKMFYRRHQNDLGKFLIPFVSSDLQCEYCTVYMHKTLWQVMDFCIYLDWTEYRGELDLKIYTKKIS